MNPDRFSPDDLDPSWARLTCRDCGDAFDGRPYADRQCEPCRIHEADLAAAERQQAWRLACLLATVLPALRCESCAAIGITSPASLTCDDCGARVCDDDHGALYPDAPDGTRAVCADCHCAEAA